MTSNVLWTLFHHKAFGNIWSICTSLHFQCVCPPYADSTMSNGYCCSVDIMTKSWNGLHVHSVLRTMMNWMPSGFIFTLTTKAFSLIEGMDLATLSVAAAAPHHTVMKPTHHPATTQPLPSCFQQLIRTISLAQASVIRAILKTRISLKLGISALTTNLSCWIQSLLNHHHSVSTYWRAISMCLTPSTKCNFLWKNTSGNCL